MGEPMEEDLLLEVGEEVGEEETVPQTVPEAEEETTTPTTNSGLVRRRKKLLERISLTFHFDFQALPSEAQEAYWKFQEDRGFSRFAIDLQRILLDHKIDDFLYQCPAFLLAVTELFDEKHPQLGLRGLCEEQGLVRDDEYPLEGRHSPFGTMYVPRVEVSDVDDSGDENRPSARLSRTLASTSLTHRTRTMRPQSQGSLRLFASSSYQIPEDEESPTQAPELEPTTTKPLIPGFVISTKRTPLASQGEKDKGTAPDQQPRETIDGPPRDIRSREEYNSGWLRNFAGDRGAPPPDFNLYPYKGWKIEPPKVLLTRAKNFLADEDVNRTIDWDRKFAELAEYFSYLLHNWKGERWGADLHECIDMLHAHRVYENYHYGKPKLNLDFYDNWTMKSWRLPRVPGRHVVVEDEEDMGERKLLFNPIRAAHDVHYEMPLDVLKKYVDEYGQDASYFWSSTGVQPRPERLTDQDSNNRRFNMVECENNAYEKSILKNMQETCSQLKSQPRPPAEQVEGTPDINSLRQFAWFRGTRRAALQQCLSQFNNAENAAVCNQWRAIIIPPRHKPRQPDAGVLFTTIQVANVPEKKARDPFSHTLAHKWYVMADQWWGAWMRPLSIKESYGERLWMHRKEAIMELPMNFKGPYILDYFDKDMRKTQELLNTCEIIWNRLDDKEKHFNRDFLTKVVNCVWTGLRAGEGIYLEQKNLVRNDGSTPVPHIRPIEAELLRFILEPSVNTAMLGIKQGANAYQSGDEGISPILGAHGRLFEERVDEMLNDISRDSFFHPAAGPESQDFMAVLNRDCDGPMKRYRFSRKEAIRYALALKKKGKIYANKGLLVRRPKVDFHPEERIRWLDSDYKDDPPVEPPVKPKIGPEKVKAKDADNVTISTDVSTEISDQKSVDLGPYDNGLPKLANIRSWDSTILDREAVSADMEKTLILYEGLGYRLGRTLRDLRAQHSKDLKSLTPEQRKVNGRYTRNIFDYWEKDYQLRANDPKWNRNVVDGSRKNRVTPKLCDTIKMAEPEAYKESWDREFSKDMQDSLYASFDILRKGIIREAYENKSMLFPSRVTRRIDSMGKTIASAPRREPVWSFGHPGRCGKGPRFWDIDRWPLHLQTDETRDLIESSGGDDSVYVIPPSLGGQRSKRTKKRTKRSKRTGEEEQEEEEEDVVREPKGKERADDISLRQLGQPFGYKYKDLAHIRRSFKPGTPEYWLGDTPLQKQRIEDEIKRGLVGSEQPRSWHQRLKDFLGSKEDDPTALPYVSPRDIPRSKSLGSVMEEDSLLILPDSSEDIPTSRPPQILVPSGDRLGFKPRRNHQAPPMNPPHLDEPTEGDEQGSQQKSDNPDPPGDYTRLTPSRTRITPPPPPEHDQAESSTAGQQSAAPTAQRRRKSRPLVSQSLQLEIIEPEQDEPERPPRDPEDEALYRALHEEFYDSYG